MPGPLPRDLVVRLVARTKILLCLDYDGTISRITARSSAARPLRGVPTLLRGLAARGDRIQVAVLTGRRIETVRRLLGLDGDAGGRVLFSGVHGLEVLGYDRHLRFAPGAEQCVAELGKVRAWLGRQLAKSRGFEIEDKQVALAVHYRRAKAGAAQALRRSLSQFVKREAPRLEILRGRMVEEVKPHGVGGKGRAVRYLLQELGEPAPVPIYFGDDLSDEDAFFALRADGVTVLVGARRRSWAKFRVEGPDEVAEVLSDLAGVLSERADESSV